MLSKKVIIRFVIFVIFFTVTLATIIYGYKSGKTILGFLSGIALFSFLLILYFYINYLNNDYLNKHKDMKWTTTKSTIWLERHFSNKYERIVLTNKEVPVKLLPQGEFRVGLIKNYDKLVLVDLRSKKIKIEFSDNESIISKDKVKLKGYISIKARVDEKENSIFKLVSNEMEEDESLKSYVRIATKTIISKYSWIELYNLNQENFVKIQQDIKQTLSKKESCFIVDDIIEISLKPLDNNFEQILEDRQKEIDKLQIKIEQLKNEKDTHKLKSELEKMKLEKEYEMKELIQKKQIELDERKHLVELKQKEDENKFEIEKLKAIDEYENERLIKRIQILESSTDAIKILDPELYVRIKLAEIKGKTESDIRTGKYQDEMIKILLGEKLARSEGKIEVLEKTVPSSTNLSIDSSKDDNEKKSEILDLLNPDEIEKLSKDELKELLTEVLKKKINKDED